MPTKFEGEILPGFYYIETLLQNEAIRKNGFYDYKVVQAMLFHNEIEKENIKFYLPGKLSPSNSEILKDFMSFTKSKSSLFKYINNVLIGSFGITAFRK